MTQISKNSLYEVLEVKGGDFERGFAYGEAHKSLISRLLESHFEYYAKHLGFDKDSVLREASLFANPIREYSEEIYEELNGIAKGAELSLDHILVIAAFNEVFYPKLSKLCTSFAVHSMVTSERLSYVGQNNDEGVEPWLDGECVVLIKHTRKSAPDFITYTYAGAPAMMGINSYGLALCINALNFSSPRVGVPMLCVAREVLNQKSLEDAINAIARAKRAYSLNFMMGTPYEIANVEASPSGVQVMKSQSFVYHANHYLCPVEGYQERTSGEYYKNSNLRCERMGQLLRSAKFIDFEYLKNVLRDHEGHPYGICRHVDTKRPKEKRSRTLDGMIYIPERKEAWIAKGNPCENEFVRYAL
jgi:isopenicillin-N N-acyltransferase-like protein